MMKTDDLVLFLAHKLKAYSKIESAYLIGSILKQTAHQFSDIDLVLFGEMNLKEQKMLKTNLEKKFHRVLDLKIFPVPTGPISYDDLSFPIISALFEKGQSKKIFGKKFPSNLISLADLKKKRLLNPLRKEIPILKSYHEFQNVHDSNDSKLNNFYTFRALLRYFESLITSYKEMGIQKRFLIYEYLLEKGVYISKNLMPRIDLQVMLIRRQWYQDVKLATDSLPKIVYPGAWLNEAFVGKKNHELILKINKISSVLYSHLKTDQYSVILYGSLTEGLFIYNDTKKSLSDFDLIIAIKGSVYDKIQNITHIIKEEITKSLLPFASSISLLREADLRTVMGRGNVISFRHQVISGFIPEIKIYTLPNYSHFILDNMLLLTAPQKNDDPQRVYYRNIKIIRRIVEYNTSHLWKENYHFDFLQQAFVNSKLGGNETSIFENILEYYGKPITPRNQNILFNTARKHLLETMRRDTKKFFLKGNLKDIEKGEFKKVEFIGIGRIGLEASLLSKCWIYCLIHFDHLDQIPFENFLEFFRQEFPLIEEHSFSKGASPIEKFQEFNGILWVYRLYYAQGFRRIELDLEYKRNVKVIFRFFDKRQMHDQFINIEDFLNKNQTSLRKIEINQIDDFYLSKECELIIQAAVNFKIPIAVRTRGTQGALKFLEETHSIGDITVASQIKWENLIEKFEIISKKKRRHIYLESSKNDQVYRYKNFSVYNV